MPPPENGYSLQQLSHTHKHKHMFIFSYIGLDPTLFHLNTTSQYPPSEVCSYVDINLAENKAAICLLATVEPFMSEQSHMVFWIVVPLAILNMAD